MCEIFFDTEAMPGVLIPRDGGPDLKGDVWKIKIISALILANKTNREKILYFLPKNLVKIYFTTDNMIKHLY